MSTLTKPSFFTREKDFYQRFFRLFFFLVLQNVITTGVNLLDNVMLGNYDEYALAGVTQVNQLQFLLQMIVGGTGEGLLILTSQYWGKRNVAAIRRVISVAMRITVFTGLLLTVATLLFPRQLLLLLIQDEQAVAEGIKYLRVMSWSYIIFCISNTLVSSLRSVEDVSLGMIMSLCTLVINGTLNYILIYGHFGAPELGTTGAAIATLAARVVELVVVLVYVLKKEKVLRFRLSDLLGIDRQIASDFIRAALPCIITSASWGVAMTVQASILGHYGVTVTDASSVANSVFQIISTLSYGGASAAGILIGKAVGKGDVDVVKSYSRTLQIIFLCIGIVTGALLFALRVPMLNIYSELNAATRGLSMKFMTILSVTVIGTSYQCAVLGGIVKAGGSPKVQTINDFCFMWGFILPLSLLGAFVWNWDPVIIFIILKCDQILKCSTAVIVCNRYKWIKFLTRPEA